MLCMYLYYVVGTVCTSIMRSRQRVPVADPGGGSRGDRPP